MSTSTRIEATRQEVEQSKDHKRILACYHKKPSETQPLQHSQVNLDPDLKLWSKYEE